MIRKCLEKARDARYPTATAVRDELETLRGDLRSGIVTGAAARRSSTARLGVCSPSQ